MVVGFCLLIEMVGCVKHGSFKIFSSKVFRKLLSVFNMYGLVSLVFSNMVIILCVVGEFVYVCVCHVTVFS